MKVFYQLVFCLAVLPGTFASVSHADLRVASAEFARVDSDAGGRARALQLAIVRYLPVDDASSFSVDLIGAVHIADRAYYTALNERFREYDALLFELVVSEPVVSDSPIGNRKGLLTHLQIEMKDALGLAFQLEEIDYRAVNFVHADLSADLLLKSMDERGESFYVYFWRLFYAMIDDYARDPLGLNDMEMMAQLFNSAEEDAFKIAIAHEMVKAVRVGDILGSDQGSAIIAARNAHAVDVLRNQLAAGARRIGIFYGAAHMIDFDRRLLNELGLKRADEEWIDAWLFERTDNPTE